MKWDYKTVVLTGGFMGRHRDELRRDQLEQQFDQLGADGWELAWVPMNQALHGERTDTSSSSRSRSRTSSRPQVARVGMRGRS
jgi:hypothetical protein